jgi:hypothetical protein
MSFALALRSAHVADAENERAHSTYRHAGLFLPLEVIVKT